MVNESDNKKEWDVFSENHFLGRITATNKEDAIELGLRLYGNHLEGILRVQRRVQHPKDGWSRPI